MKLCALFVPIMAYVQGLDRLEMPQASEVNDALQRLIKQAKDTALSEEIGITQFNDALFPVVAWTDERLSLLPAWQETRPWRSFMLQRKFFSTSLAGVQFFERLEKLEKNNQELREIYVTCLALGFVGRYSINPNAPELAELLQHQYKLLRPEQTRKSSTTSGVASLFPEAYRLVTNRVRHRHLNVGSRIFWLFVILVPALLIGALAYWFDSLLSIQASEITRRLP
jgi:type VI secretion system protein ImpK